MSNNWLYDLVTWCVQEGREDVEAWTASARGRGNQPLDQLARRVVFQQAQLAAKAYVTPAAVGSIPGLGRAVSAQRINAEVGFVIYRMVKSILYQAAVYGRAHDNDVVDMVLLTLGLALGHGGTRTALVEGGQRAPARSIVAISGAGGAATYAGVLSAEIAARFEGRGQLGHLPIVGRPFLGAQNFIFISAAALAGRFVFNDLTVTREELNELDMQMRAWSRTMLSLMAWMARADGEVDGTETETIRSLQHSLVMPGLTNAELAVELIGPPNWEKIRQQFKTEDERAGLLENLLMVVWADGRKTDEEDRLCRRVAAELVADRMIDDIEQAVRESMHGDVE